VQYMRPHGAAFPSNMRGNGPVGMASYSSMLARGNRDDSPSTNAGQVVPVHATANSVPGQSGYCFSLPWYRLVLI
jgi:pre-mRNA 3'-end-processing factor FIP1